MKKVFNKVQINIDHKLTKGSGEQFVIKAQAEFELSNGVIGVYGNSGHGKSTLLKIIARIIESNSSIVWFDHEQNEHVFITAEDSPVVYQDQSVILFEHQTVEQNLRFVLNHSKWSKLYTTDYGYQDVINWCGISKLLQQPAANLSGGEKQRVALARSLLSGKPVVVLDEPFSGLDWQARTELLSLIKQLNEQFHIVFIVVSHLLQELALCCKYVLNIEHGRIAQHGAVTSVIQQLTLASSEPIFSRIKVVKGKRLDEEQLIQWQLITSSEQVIYSKHPSILTFNHYEESEEQVLIVEADKVSISKSAAQDSSMLNQLKGKITNIESYNHLILVEINIDGQTLLSLISLLSYKRLDLLVGQVVYAQFKAL